MDEGSVEEDDAFKSWNDGSQIIEEWDWDDDTTTNAIMNEMDEESIEDDNTKITIVIDRNDGLDEEIMKMIL